MTVTVYAPSGGGIEDMARACMDRELSGQRDYPTRLRELAEGAIANYLPAYVALDRDPGILLAAEVIMSEGIGLRAYASRIEADDLRRLAKCLKPANAMAQLDHELLASERGLTQEEIAHG